MTRDQLQEWHESNLVLGGSWYPRPNHSELGRGADFEMIQQSIERMKGILIYRGITIDNLHDFLQTNVTRFDMLFHEFLRFERSQEFLEIVISQIIADSDFLFPSKNNDVLRLEVG